MMGGHQHNSFASELASFWTKALIHEMDIDEAKYRME